MWLGVQVGYSLHFQQYGSRMGERQRWASVAAQHNGLLQSRHPTYACSGMMGHVLISS